MFRHTYPPLAAFKTEWRCLLWPTLAGFELAHLNAAKMGWGPRARNRLCLCLRDLRTAHQATLSAAAECQDASSSDFAMPPARQLQRGQAFV